MGDVLDFERAKPVRIGFSYAKGFQPVSWFVRWATKAPCSHCFFLVWDETLQMEMVLQAEPKGFDPTPWERFKADNNIVAMWTPRHAIIKGLRRVARKYLDTPYYYLGLFGMATVAIGQFFKRQWTNPFQSKTQVFCSDVSAIACRASSSAYDALRPGSTSPGMLLTWALVNEPERVERP